MYILIIILSIISVLFIYWGQLNDADIQIAPVIGVVFGALYSTQEFKDETEYVLQCCILCISLQVIWIKKHNGLG